MQMTLLTSLDEWDAIHQEWDELLDRSFRPYPFLESWYLFNWWQTLGGGEWPRETSTLQIITARENGQLAGVAPLFSSSKSDSQPALRFIAKLRQVTISTLFANMTIWNLPEPGADFVDRNEQITSALELPTSRTVRPQLPCSRITARSQNAHLK